MLLVVLCAMISPMSGQLQQPTQQRQFWNPRQPQQPTATWGRLSPSMDPARPLLRARAAIPIDWNRPQPSAPVIRLPPARWNSPAQRGRLNRSPEDDGVENNEVMDNEDSILAGSMSPQFLKELSDYLYGLITGKYQPRRQHSRQPAGGGLMSNEVVLDYEEETRALDARNRGLDPMAASVLRSPARLQSTADRRAQSRRLPPPTRVVRPRPQPGPALTPPGTAQVPSQAPSPEEFRTVQGPPLARRLPTLFQDAPRRLPQTSEMVESSRTLPRDELIPSQMGSQPTRTRQGPQRVMLLTNPRRPAPTSSQGASRSSPEIAQQRRPQNSASSSATSQSPTQTPFWTTTTTSPRIATNLSVASQNRTRTMVSGASFSRRRNVRQGISRRRPSSARRSSSKRRSEGTIRRSRSSGEI